MKKIFFLISLLLIGCSKDDDLIINPIEDLNHTLLSVNVQRFSNDINWNDHKKELQSELYINSDDIPDIIAPDESDNNSIKSQKVNIIIYNIYLLRFYGIFI
jgi:hypothetical protein